MDDTTVVCCRLPRANWTYLLLPGIYGVMAAWAAHSPNKNGPPNLTETTVWESISVLCLLMVLGMAWWLLRACIICNSAGLRRRGLGGWKSVCWEEVTDYYEKLPTRTQRSVSAKQPTVVSVAETPFGLWGVSNLWSNASALRVQIAFHAVKSRAQQWEIKGTRLVDPWPRVFDYDTCENRWAPRIWFKLFSAYVFYLLIQPALKLTAMVGGIGWAMTLAAAALYLLLMGSFGLIFLLPLAQYRAANRRKTERITVDPNGIIFESETQRVEALWPEVIGYHSVNGQGLLVQYAVETQNGSFDFLPSIRNAALLKEIIQRFAKASADQQWCSRVDMEVLGGEAARWSSGRVGAGSRVYHYRNRMNRALLWLPLMLGFVFLLSAILAWQGLAPGQNMLPSLIATAANGLIALLGYYAYRTCRIETDDEGLTQITLLGKRRLRWPQIENYFLAKERNGIVIGRVERIMFSPQIAGYDDLKAEIASKAASDGTWEQEAAQCTQDGLRRGRRMRE